MNEIGFMQGRLSPVRQGLIQEFPECHWENEFELGSDLGLNLMEWTIDQHTLSSNPIMSDGGRAKIAMLQHRFGYKIPSVTGDCFMQLPFWITDDSEVRNLLLQQFIKIVGACSAIGASLVVVPLVDNGSIRSQAQERMALEVFSGLGDTLRKLNILVAFESDYSPEKLAGFISVLDPTTYGINYDSGNSAALGYCPHQEFTHYGDRVVNVHIKDRLLGGGTVPLGEGNCDFRAVFDCLSTVHYAGNLILQTARAPNDDHAGVLRKHIEFTRGQLTGV